MPALSANLSREYEKWWSVVQARVRVRWPTLEPLITSSGHQLCVSPSVWGWTSQSAYFWKWRLSKHVRQSYCQSLVCSLNTVFNCLEHVCYVVDVLNIYMFSIHVSYWLFFIYRTFSVWCIYGCNNTLKWRGVSCIPMLAVIRTSRH